MFGNMFNRTLFCDPNTNWSSPAFGQVFTQCNHAAVDPVRLPVRLLAHSTRWVPPGRARCPARGTEPAPAAPPPCMTAANSDGPPGRGMAASHKADRFVTIDHSPRCGCRVGTALVWPRAWCLSSVSCWRRPRGGPRRPTDCSGGRCARPAGQACRGRDARRSRAGPRPDTRAVACSVLGTIRIRQERFERSVRLLQEASGSSRAPRRATEPRRQSTRSSGDSSRAIPAVPPRDGARPG